MLQSSHHLQLTLLTYFFKEWYQLIWHIFCKVTDDKQLSPALFLQRACPPPSDIIGSDIHEMFWNPVKTTDLSWNFEKFLIDSVGHPVYRFAPEENPSDMNSFINKMVKDKSKGD